MRSTATVAAVGVLLVATTLTGVPWPHPSHPVTANPVAAVTADGNTDITCDDIASFPATLRWDGKDVGVPATDGLSVEVSHGTPVVTETGLGRREVSGLQVTVRHLLPTASDPDALA